jgi:hypothetical protein
MEDAAYVGLPSRLASRRSASRANSEARSKAGHWPRGMLVTVKGTPVGDWALLGDVAMPTPVVGTGCGSILSALRVLRTGRSEPWYGAGAMPSLLDDKVVSVWTRGGSDDMGRAVRRGLARVCKPCFAGFVSEWEDDDQ